MTGSVRSLLAFWIGGAAAPPAAAVTGTPQETFTLPHRGTVYTLERGTVFQLPARGTVYILVTR